MPRMALVVVILNLLLCVILCDKKEFIINYGLLSIFILVALEYANLPLPSEVILPLIGMVSFVYAY